MRLLVVTLLLLICSTVMAVDRYPFANDQQKQRFDHLTHQFRCLVCQNEDLAGSNAGLAEDLRHQIYQMINAGKTDQAIKDYMVSRYGSFVLLKPSFEKNTLLLWVTPFMLLMIGFIILWRVIRKG